MLWTDTRQAYQALALALAPFSKVLGDALHPGDASSVLPVWLLHVGAQTCS
jgi:hypothetical protein